MYWFKTDPKDMTQDNLMVTAMPLDEFIIQVLCLMDDLGASEKAPCF